MKGFITTEQHAEEIRAVYGDDFLTFCKSQPADATFLSTLANFERIEMENTNSQNVPVIGIGTVLDLSKIPSVQETLYDMVQGTLHDILELTPPSAREPGRVVRIRRTTVLLSCGEAISLLDAEKGAGK